MFFESKILFHTNINNKNTCIRCIRCINIADALISLISPTATDGGVRPEITPSIPFFGYRTAID